MVTLRAGDMQPVAVVLRFIDCINRRDVEGMGRLMNADHELHEDLTSLRSTGKAATRATPATPVSSVPTPNVAAASTATEAATRSVAGTTHPINIAGELPQDDD